MCACAQYNTYSTHYKETDCLREMIEPFMYNVGVDIVLHGEHFSCRVYCRIFWFYGGGTYRMPWQVHRFVQSWSPS